MRETTRKRKRRKRKGRKKKGEEEEEVIVEGSKTSREEGVGEGNAREKRGTRDV